jgi:hypothetical protein
MGKVSPQVGTTRGCQTTHCHSPCFLQKMPRGWDSGWHTQPWLRVLRSPRSGPRMTSLHTWLAHALLDTFQPSGSQCAGLLRKAAVSLLGQLPEAGSRPCAGLTLHADRHFFKAVSETEIVTDSILPAFWSRPEKGEVLSVDRKCMVSLGVGRGATLEPVIPRGQQPQTFFSG